MRQRRAHITGSVTLRRADAQDAAEAAAVLIHSRGAAVGTIPPTAHSDEEVRRWVETGLIPHCDVWMAESDDHQALALLVLDEDWIDQLYVHPDAAGLGIGTRLIALAKEQRPNGLQLRTFATNPGAQRFYERHGFVIAEQNDDSANEEKQPDLRYVWLGAHS
jgi:GNAT superfamily N-acetyltransferase